MVTPPTTPPTTPPAAAAGVGAGAPSTPAYDAAGAAAARAGVVVRPLDDIGDLERASLLAAEVWRSPDTRALEASLLRALEHSGNFVAGAFEADDPATMVGMSVGFRTGVPVAGLHSHMTCTDERRRGVGLGYALKLHQRAWALGQGLGTITWTFDPLAGRNAYFNLAKLGATAEAYLPNFYGAMTDGLNAGDESDRMMVRWELATASGARGATVPDVHDVHDEALLLASGPDGAPVRRPAHGERVGCQVPDDVVRMREVDPALALRWRHALRSAMQDAIADGYGVAGFSRSGCYVLARPGPAAAAGG